MAKNDVKLIGGWASPFAIRPRIALNIKSVDYEYIEETFVPKSQLLLESNPVHQKVPVLIHNGKPICESLVIVEYIDEFWSSAPSLLPSDPYDRAIARFWVAYIDQKWYPNMRGLMTAEGKARDELIKQMKEGFGLLEEALVKSSKGKAYFGGDEIGYVDIAFGSFLSWVWATAKMIEIDQLLDEAETPSLFKWAHTFSSHPAVKDVMPETDKIVEFAKVLAARIRAAKAS